MWTLQATHHHQSINSTPLPTLGRHIIEGQAKWGDDIKFTGEFHYIKGYWEWTEDILSRCKNSLQKVFVYASLFTYDNSSNIMRAFCEAWCPSTNTLLTSFGELSISLWDLHTLAGLPIIGSLYDEVVPCAKELTGFDEMASQFLPRSCAYLLHAYHHLRKIVNGSQSSQVPVSEWIRFWSKKLTKYNKPPPRTEKKRVARPKSTYNPLGNLDVHGEWSPPETSFSNINIKEGLREEHIWQRFLACWLCVFVLPNDRINMIRPKDLQDGGEHGKRANKSTCGSCLASIYKRPNKIASSPRPSRVYSTFPINFVHGWLAHYFKTHHQEFERNYFLAIRSNYLPLRQDGYFVVEPTIVLTVLVAGRFGFYQVVPGVLKQDVRRASLDEGIHYWRLCTLSKSFSKACLSCMPPNAKKFSFEDYKTWWNKVHGCYFQENIASLINMEQSDELPRGIRPNNGGDLVDANSQASLPVAPLANECNAQANKRKSISHPAEESSSNSNRHWKRPKKDSGSLLSQDVDDTVDHPLQIETFAEELEKDLVNIDDDKLQGSQRSIVRLNELARNSAVDKAIQEETRDLAKATKTPHCAAFSEFKGGKFLYKHQREFLQNMWSDLREILASTSIDFISSIKEDVFVVLESMKSFKNFDISHLEELLEAFFAEKAAAYDDEARSISSEKGSKELLKNLTASLKQQQELLQIAQAEVFDIEEGITAIESISPLSDEAVESLKVSASHLETAKEELKNLNPFA
ncbi:hypothetical protein DH2020_018639 [Rehmannia glutinosa]|uniref:Aminotransferase-like plant mobile domain-containing protein n=1 Tax=Rehmannia glutinosa TaxID=99300 RepID=A0ABR0WJV3_REHGL